MSAESAAYERYMERLEDSGAPVCQQLSSQFHKARQQHGCTRCGKLIQAGTVYRSEFWLVDGDAWFDKACATCLDEEHGY